MSTTVIIVNWNTGKWLGECLTHLESQTLQPKKIILVDNASSDEDLIHHMKFPESVEILRLQENLGFAGANNRALEKCDTDWVALLNPDAFPEPDWLEKMTAAAKDNPEFTAFGCRQVCHDDHNVLDGTGDNFHISGLAYRESHGLPQESQDLLPREIFSPCAAAALYHRQALVDIGGFDEDFFCYVEDVDLGFRLRLAGHKSKYVPSAVVYHVGSASSGGQSSDFAIYHGFRNIVWTYIKNMPGILFWVLLPLHLSLNVLSIFQFWRQGKINVILKSKKDAWLGIPKMWRKRREIQAKRTASVMDIWAVLDKRWRLPVKSRENK